MPFADRFISAAMLRSLLLALLCGSGAGCASVMEPLKSLKDAVVGALPAPAAASAPAPASPAVAETAKPAASAPVAAVSGAASAPAPLKIEAPVDPAAQRAFDEARRALRSGRTADAERGFAALVQVHPELGGPHANLGLIYREAGKTAQAVAELEQAVRVSPQQPVFFNQLGVAYRVNGQFTKAREAYEQAIALDDNYAAAVLNLGILNDLYLADGKRALELYDRYLALSPAGDATVSKWIADLKNRKSPPVTVSRKEKE